MANYIKEYATIQSGDSCWFHSIMNGLLVSRRGRMILEYMVYQYASGISENLKKTINIPVSSCPRTSGVMPVHDFMRRVYQLLYKKATLNSGVAVRNIVESHRSYTGNIRPDAPTEQFIKIIKTSGLYKYTSLFDSNLEASFPLLGLKIGPSRPKNFVTFGNTTYKLDHSIIGMFGTFNHAVCGTVIDGSYYVIDSNGFFFKCEWKDPKNILKNEQYREFCSRAYNQVFERATILHSVYTTTNAIRLNLIANMNVNQKPVSRRIRNKITIKKKKPILSKHARLGV